MNEKPTPYDQDPDGHPLFEALRAYQQDELTDEEDEAIRDHLVDCDECAAVVLELAGLAPSGELETEELSKSDVDRAWQGARKRLHEEAVVQAPQVATPPSRRPASRRFSPRVLALAAVVLVAIAASFMQRRQAAMEVTLQPTDASRSQEDTSACTTLPDAASWLLHLPLRDGHDFPSYQLRVKAEDHWLPDRPLERAPDGFAVRMTGTDLPPGRYWLSVVAAEEDGTPPLEQYCIDVEIPNA